MADSMKNLFVLEDTKDDGTEGGGAASGAETEDSSAGVQGPTEESGGAQSES